MVSKRKRAGKREVQKKVCSEAGEWQRKQCRRWQWEQKSLCVEKRWIGELAVNVCTAAVASLIYVAARTYLTRMDVGFNIGLSLSLFLYPATFWMEISTPRSR